MVRAVPLPPRGGDPRGARARGPRLILREATAADATQLAECRWLSSVEEEEEPRVARDEFERRFRAFVGRALASGRWTVFVAEDASRIVATTYVQEIERVPRPRDRVGPWGYVTGVFTRPEARNAGVGRRLLDHVIAWAKARPLHLLLLWPSERSVPFYRRAGFVGSPEAHELAFTED